MLAGWLSQTKDGPHAPLQPEQTLATHRAFGELSEYDLVLLPGPPPPDDPDPANFRAPRRARLQQQQQSSPRAAAAAPMRSEKLTASLLTQITSVETTESRLRDQIADLSVMKAEAEALFSDAVRQMHLAKKKAQKQQYASSSSGGSLSARAKIPSAKEPKWVERLMADAIRMMPPPPPRTPPPPPIDDDPYAIALREDAAEHARLMASMGGGAAAAGAAAPDGTQNGQEEGGGVEGESNKEEEEEEKKEDGEGSGGEGKGETTSGHKARTRVIKPSLDPSLPSLEGKPTPYGVLKGAGKHIVTSEEERLRGSAKKDDDDEGKRKDKAASKTRGGGGGGRGRSPSRHALVSSRFVQPKSFGGASPPRTLPVLTPRFFDAKAAKAAHGQLFIEENQLMPRPDKRPRTPNGTPLWVERLSEDPRAARLPKPPPSGQQQDGGELGAEQGGGPPHQPPEGGAEGARRRTRVMAGGEEVHHEYTSTAASLSRAIPTRQMAAAFLAEESRASQQNADAAAATGRGGGRGDGATRQLGTPSTPGGSKDEPHAPLPTEEELEFLYLATLNQRARLRGDWPERWPKPHVEGDLEGLDDARWGASAHGAEGDEIMWRTQEWEQSEGGGTAGGGERGRTPSTAGGGPRRTSAATASSFEDELESAMSGAAPPGSLKSNVWSQVETDAERASKPQTAGGGDPAAAVTFAKIAFEIPAATGGKGSSTAKSFSSADPEREIRHLLTREAKLKLAVHGVVRDIKLGRLKGGAAADARLTATEDVDALKSDLAELSEHLAARAQPQEAKRMQLIRERLDPLRETLTELAT